MKKNVKKESILKGAGVLLIATIMVLSASTVTADTINENAVSLTNETAKSVQTNLGRWGINSDGLLWDNGLPDGRNGISCCYWPANPLDRENIDDFHNDVEWTITDGHFRYLTNSGAGPEAIQAVKVFIYPSTGPCEPDTERHAERNATFNAYLTGDEYFGRPEIAIDCDFDPIVCPPGEWWICFQPQLNENGFWLTAPNNECPIWVSMPDQSHPKWTSSMAVFGEDYDLAWYITGEGGAAPELEIENITGGIGVNSVIKNIGDADATNVEWSIRLDGGIIIFPSGGEATGNFTNIPAEGEGPIKTMVFGFGGFLQSLNVTVSAEADNANPVEKTVTAKVFLFFVII